MTKRVITLVLGLVSALISEVNGGLLEQIASTFNEKQVAIQLEESAFGLPEFQPILDRLEDMDDRLIRDTLDKMSGVQYTNVGLISQLASRQFNRRVFDPVRSALVSNPCAPYVYCTYQPTIDIWASLGGGGIFVRGHRNSRNFEAPNLNFALGVQGRFIRELTVGAALFVQKSNVSYSLGGSLRNNIVLGGLYALYRPKHFYIFADFNAGNSTNKGRRRIKVDDLLFTARSNFQVNQGGYYAEVGTDLAYNFVLVQPFIAIEGWSYQLGRIRERNAFPLDLSIRVRSRNDAMTRLGIHLSSAPLKNGWSAGMDISWNYLLSSEKNSISATFRHFGTSFTVDGLRSERNSFEVNAYFYKQINKCWDFYFETNAIGWQNVIAYSFVGGLQMTW